MASSPAKQTELREISKQTHEYNKETEKERDKKRKEECMCVSEGGGGF